MFALTPQAFANHFLCEESSTGQNVCKDLWSDFKDGSDATDYQNGDSVTISSLNIGSGSWMASESFGEACTVMTGTEEHKLKSVACSSQARYACTKPGMSIDAFLSTYRMFILCFSNSLPLWNG